MALSVKSMASWSLAEPRFSMVGILCPIVGKETFVSTSSRVVSVLFREEFCDFAYLEDRVRAR